MNFSMIYVLITALLFTTYEPVVKLIAADINPYAITAIRFFIGALVLLPFSVRDLKAKKIKLLGKDYGIMGGLGILFICVSMTLLQIAIKVAESPALIAIIFSSNSIWTIALSAIFLNAKLTKTKIVGIVLCAAGVLLSADLSKGTNLLSVVLAFLSALTFSVYTVLSKKYMTRVSGLVQTGISFLMGSVILAVILMIFGVEITGGISGGNILILLFISVMVTGVGYWAYFSAMRVGGAQTAALAFFVKPILTPFATFIINGIVPGANIILAVILVVLGATLAGDILKR